MINSISFGAKYISSDNIKQLDLFKKTYSPRKVSIVKIDGTNEADVKAVGKAVTKWKDAAYAQSIQCVLNSIFARFIEPEERTVFAITTQNKNHGKLKNKKILALAEVNTSKDSTINLDYLQVNPDYIHTAKSRKYKGIGSCMLNFLKQTFQKPITLQSDFHVTNFYTKNKFDVLDAKKFKYIWNPNRA